MTTSIAAGPARPPWRSPGRAVVAGVDGSAHNAAAIEYAAALAARMRRTLRLTAVIDAGATGAVVRLVKPGAPAWGRGGQALHQDRARVAQTHPDVLATEHLREGSPVSELVDASREEAVLVVGRRGIGATERILLGSTSIGVAGRSLVPVVIVPDEWAGATAPEAPVVAALHPGAHLEMVLDYAFTEAHETGAPLTVVRIPEPQAVSPYDAWFGPASYPEEPWEQPIEPGLAPYRALFPDVAVTVLEPKGSPVKRLLRESGYARLLVIGRHHRGPWGLGLGSVARGVLHKAQVPVAVVPAS